MGKSILVSIFSICLCTMPMVADAQLQSNLEGYWQFNVNGLDSSTNEHDLDLVGGPGFDIGLLGCGLRLTGNPDQYGLGFANETIFDVGGDDFTIQVWVNFNSTAGEQTLFEKFTGSAGPGYTLTKLAGNGFQFFAAGLGSVSSPLQTIPIGQWQQVVARRTGTEVEILLNNSSIALATLDGSVTASPNPVLIGERNGSQQFPVNGLIDEVAFWSRALSDDEISQLYNDGQGLAMVSDPNVLLGDVNQDGAVDLLDVSPFILLLSNGGYLAEADLNADCVVNLLDVDPFVLVIIGG